MRKVDDKETISRVMRRMGRKGGKRRLQTMTAAERSEVARKAAAKSAEVRSARSAARRSETQPRSEEKAKHTRTLVRV
jgi:hypothetical protein